MPSAPLSDSEPRRTSAGREVDLDEGEALHRGKDYGHAGEEVPVAVEGLDEGV